MKFRRMYAIAFVLMTTMGALACGNDSTTPSPTVASIAVTGTAPAVGATSQFTAMAIMTNGSAQDVTTTATWTTSNTADATVSAAGLVTGVGAGNVTVQATYQSVVGAEQITVNP